MFVGSFHWAEMRGCGIFYLASGSLLGAAMTPVEYASMFYGSFRWCGNERLRHILFGCGIFIGGRNDVRVVCFSCFTVVSAGAENEDYSTSFHERSCGAPSSAAGSFLGAAMTFIDEKYGVDNPFFTSLPASLGRR